MNPLYSMKELANKLRFRSSNLLMKCHQLQSRVQRSHEFVAQIQNFRLRHKRVPRSQVDADFVQVPRHLLIRKNLQLNRRVLQKCAALEKAQKSLHYEVHLLDDVCNKATRRFVPCKGGRVPVLQTKVRFERNQIGNNGLHLLLYNDDFLHTKTNFLKKVTGLPVICVCNGLSKKTFRDFQRKELFHCRISHLPNRPTETGL